jgi:TrmH family RNA methyltransferase
MQPLRITRRNSTFQLLAALASNRQKRHSTRTFLLEGVRPINAARAHGWRFDALIVPFGGRLSRWAADVIDAVRPPVIYEMSPALLAELSGKDDPSELLAVMHMPEDDIGRVPVRPDLLVAVIDRPSNPGNLGTLIRSCDAFGVHGLIVTGHAVDLYDPATITASRGSLFAVPVVRTESHADVAAWVGRARATLGACRIVGADEKAGDALFDHDFRAPTVAIFGNETHGLSRAYRQMCDATVRIPIQGTASSLNVSVAASVVFYEIGRQRRLTRPSPPG